MPAPEAMGTCRNSLEHLANSVGSSHVNPSIPHRFEAVAVNGRQTGKRAKERGSGQGHPRAIGSGRVEAGRRPILCQKALHCFAAKIRPGSRGTCLVCTS